MKKCPFCAEEIQDEALKCRYCGEFLEKSGEGQASQPASEPTPPNIAAAGQTKVDPNQQAVNGCCGCFLLVFLFFLFMGSCSNSNSSSSSPPAASTSDSGGKPAVNGDETKVTGDVFGASNSQAESELYSAIRAKDTDRVRRMVAEGRVYFLSSGTRVVVVDRGFASTTVRISSGSDSGSTCIIPNEYLGHLP